MSAINKRKVSIALIASGTAAIVVLSYVISQPGNAPTRPAQPEIVKHLPGNLPETNSGVGTLPLNGAKSALNATPDSIVTHQPTQNDAGDELHERNSELSDDTGNHNAENKHLTQFTSANDISELDDNELQTEISNIETYIDDNKFIDQLNDEKFNPAEVKQLTGLFEHLTNLRHQQINTQIDQLNTQIDEYDSVQVSLIQRYDNGEFYDDKKFSRESLEAEIAQENNELIQRREAQINKDADALREPTRQTTQTKQTKDQS